MGYAGFEAWGVISKTFPRRHPICPLKGEGPIPPGRQLPKEYSRKGISGAGNAKFVKLFKPQPICQNDKNIKLFYFMELHPGNFQQN